MRVFVEAAVHDGLSLSERSVTAMLLRTDPFRELDRLAEQLLGTAARPATMPMAAYEREGTLWVHLDLPGIDPDSIDLSVEQNL